VCVCVCVLIIIIIIILCTYTHLKYFSNIVLHMHSNLLRIHIRHKTNGEFANDLCVCVNMYVWVCVCVCMCVRISYYECEDITYMTLLMFSLSLLPSQE